jgi:hypothetical protein
MVVSTIHNTFGAAFVGVIASSLYESSSPLSSVVHSDLTDHGLLQRIRYLHDAVLQLLRPVPPGSTILQDTGAYSIVW